MSEISTTKLLNTKTSRVVQQFHELDVALIDASSIIYIKKSGFLAELSTIVSLYTLPEIVKETGFDQLLIHLIDEKMVSNSNDEKLVECAKKNLLPIISEDKKIILQVKQANIPYFNALMMLNFVFGTNDVRKKIYLGT